MTKEIAIEPGLYAQVGKRITSYSARIDGKRVPLGNNEASARAKFIALTQLDPGPRTIREMCEGFIKEQRQRLKEKAADALAPLTVADYEDDLKNVCKVFGGMSPSEFKPTHGAQWLKRRRDDGSPVAGNRELAALGSAFNYGMREGVVEANPCLGIRRNRERPRTRKVSRAELNAFLKHAAAKGGSSYMVAVIGSVVALTGRRRAEILRLHRDAITKDGVSVKSAKIKPGEPERFYLVGWSPTLRQVLEAGLAIPRRTRGLYLFPNNDGEPYTDPGFKCLWNKLMHSYAPGGATSPEWFRAHDLRALYVSEMLGEGRDPNTHKNPATMHEVYDRREVIKVSPLA